MTIDPLVSIIIPARNAEIFIQRCLNSILPVSRDIPLEVIAIVNGSTDRTEELTNLYRDTLSIKLYVSKVAIGPAAARNAGINMSNGKWLYFLDADDLIPVGALQGHLELMSSTKADVLVGAYLKVADTPKKSDHQLTGAKIFDPENLQAYVLKYVMEPYKYTMPVHCWGKLYLRRSVIAVGARFDDSLVQLEDVNFNFSLILKNLMFEYTNKIMYQYHINSNPNNLSSQSGDSLDAIKGIQVAYSPVRALLEKWEAEGTIKNARSLYSHLLATTSLLWLIRTGKRFRKSNWASCKILVERILKNPEFRSAMRDYREMPNTSRIISSLVRMDLSFVLCLYFKIKSMKFF